MGTKVFETRAHTCDRCGNVERIERDANAPPHREYQTSKGLLLIVGSDTLFGPEFKRVLEQNQYPESAHEVRLWLCHGCRGELATFLNAKQ